MNILVNDTQRNRPDRRYARGGGRRSTDGLPRHAESPACPSCLAAGAAMQAGEADGGWWFVCGACDHMWNERARAAGTSTEWAPSVGSGLNAG